ncbi:MAG: FKBP-type peptidyl-prolyl cis-trans isomerase [Syntrophobacteria bacterium]
MFVLSAALLMEVCLAGENLDFKDERVRFSYSLGFRIGGDIKRRDIQVKPELLLKGVQDAVAGNKPLMTQREMRSTLATLNKEIAAAQEQEMKARAEQNLAAGKAFLAEKAKEEGVTTLPSGLEFKVIKEGSGRTPESSDTVTVHYRGTLIDGTEFDSSYRRSKPATFRVEGVIPGWTEALQLMKEGARWQLFIPPELAYGDKRTQKIEPNSTLIFELELISIKSSE